MNPIPTSPDDMPSEFHNNANGIRNMLVTLDSNRFVSIVWEMDVEATNRDGENVGEWNVEVQGGRSQPIRAKHSELLPALWYCVEIANAKDTEAYQQRDAARKAALAKLSTEERKILGI